MQDSCEIACFDCERGDDWQEPVAVHTTARGTFVNIIESTFLPESGKIITAFGTFPSLDPAMCVSRLLDQVVLTTYIYFLATFYN
jgi:hypothetical protein